MKYLEQANALKQKVELWLPAAGGAENTELSFNGYEVCLGKTKIFENT